MPHGRISLSFRGATRAAKLLPLLSLLALWPRSTLGQLASAPGSRPWQAIVRAGVSTPLEKGYSGIKPSLALGIRTRLTTAVGLTLEFAYAGLGHTSSSNPSLTPFPESAPAVAIHKLTQSVLSLGATGDIALTTNRVRPSLLIGLHGARVRSTFTEILTDTTGQQLSLQRFRENTTRLLLTLGLSVGLPPIHGVTPAIEVRYHAIPIRGDDTRSTQEFLTLGLALRV
jgi:hypothetical protein